MANGTFIKLYRKITEHELYIEKRVFSRLEAWEDILLTVEWDTGLIEMNLAYLADRWNWSKMQVFRFITYLVDEEMVSKQKNKHTITLTVLNWEIYQGGNGNSTKKTKPPLSPANDVIGQEPVAEILDYWNKHDIIVHHKLSDEIKKEVKRALQQHSIEEIKKSIEHYAQMLKDESYEYCSYKWTLANFLKREKGYEYFLDDGEKWVSYQNRIKKQPEAKTTKSTTNWIDPDELANRWKE